MKFHKYCSFNPYILKNIRDKTITLSKPRLFNDPFDCLVYWDKTKFNYIQNYVIPHQRDCTFVYSLTKIFASPIMWAHYADSHYGFCIEYEIGEDIEKDVKGTKLFEEGEEILSIETGSAYSYLFKVKYCSKRFDATESMLYIDNNKEDINETMMKKQIEFVQYKDKNWEYENEYRLAYFCMNDIETRKDRFLVTSPQITGIYFGERSVDLVDKDKIYYREDLKRICKERDIPTYIMKKHETEYKMVADPFKLFI